MKIQTPAGEFNSCFDDSCDGAHCQVCGGHFVDFYNSNLRICDRCDMLNPDQQEQVKAVVKNIGLNCTLMTDLEMRNPRGRINPWRLN